MDRMLEDAFIMPREGGGQGWGGPAMDVYEESDNFVVEAHLPGLKPEDLEVQVEQGYLPSADERRPRKSTTTASTCSSRSGQDGSPAVCSCRRATTPSTASPTTSTGSFG